MTKICGHCQQPFAGKPQRKFCSLKCHAQWREGNPVWRAARDRGRAKSNATNRQQSDRRFLLAAEQCASKARAWRNGERRGYQVGYHAGRRAGFTTGHLQGFQEGLRQGRYEQAMRRSA